MSFIDLDDKKEEKHAKTLCVKTLLLACNWPYKHKTPLRFNCYVVSKSILNIMFLNRKKKEIVQLCGKKHLMRGAIHVSPDQKTEEITRTARPNFDLDLLIFVFCVVVVCLFVCFHCGYTCVVEPLCTAGDWT